jgi:formate dehydrogenase subunit beta
MISGEEDRMDAAAGTPYMLRVENGPEGSVLELLGDVIGSGKADALILPFRVPSGDSFAWILFSDVSLLKEAVPFPATMPVQGGKALRSLTRKERGNLKVIALMRPCEIRAGIELSKLGQVNTENLILASYDCPGAVRLEDYVSDPASCDCSFSGMRSRGEPSGNVRSTCSTCRDFSMVDADIHFGYFGIEDGRMLVVPGSPAGRALLEDLNLEEEEGLFPQWKAEISRLAEKRTATREETFRETEKRISGFDGMLATFSNCIGCHNCQSACPICYCRLCYFDSEVSGNDPEALMTAAEKRGGISLPPDRIMFHTGRLAHMSLSCVSCGQCSDACPVSIPVADVFSFVAERTQRTFEYKAGKSDGEALPLRRFLKAELDGVHDMVMDAESEASPHE